MPKIAIVGATGMVGQEMLKVLEESGIKPKELLLTASDKSIGKKIDYQGHSYTLLGIDEVIRYKPDIAIFSAGGSTSLQYAPQFANLGCYVIDNSSAWRMDPQCPLVVPEINANAIHPGSFIIANPNCSTIQMVMALHPLHQNFEIDRIVVSTYQSFTGTGMKAVRQYESEKNGHLLVELPAYPHPIFENCIPQCDVFLDNLYTKEEMKLVHETRKILDAPSLRITATAVRVPVYGGHSESINVSFKKDIDLGQVRLLLNNTRGLKLLDDPNQAIYPTPLQARGRNEVFVGRVRMDESQANTLNLWVTADNLRKGAATNAIQIADYLINNSYINN
ncbi:MAG: aspartate-semialdehyde dehydrogenase [Saprospiraceae bacterium]|nr:aspartate-semialdehyde dehydrogenase [Saprospiraceae bacterium]